MILYPQYDSESAEQASSAAEKTIIDSAGNKAARIALISEIKQPVPSIIKESVPESISESVPSDGPEIVDEVDVTEAISPAEVSVRAGSID